MKYKVHKGILVLISFKRYASR